MSAKHTPGPWRLSRSASDSVVCDTPGAHNSPDSIAYYGGHLIAESIELKNRQLIAAAPELLEALRSAVELYGAPGGPWNVPGDPGAWITLARAALAKATGEPA